MSFLEFNLHDGMVAIYFLIVRFNELIFARMTGLQLPLILKTTIADG